MKKIFLFLMLFSILPVFSKTITGEIKKEDRADINRIYDLNTNKPISGAIVKLPSKNYRTVTTEDGAFKLGTRIDAPTIMSVEKSGYKPFSMTIKDSFDKEPISIGIEKTTPFDVVLETDMIHLGDNSYSENSANANQFRLSADGAFYNKEFKLKNLNSIENIFLIIGSIIGIDTVQAQKLGQSRVLTAYSSPPEIFCNGNKIAEIKINGDNQRISIPKSLLNGNEFMNITIRTGKNLYKTTDIDYDDIEFTNLLLELK